MTQKKYYISCDQCQNKIKFKSDLIAHKKYNHIKNDHCKKCKNIKSDKSNFQPYQIF